MAKKLDQPQGRGDFFKSMGTIMAGYLAEQVEEAITKASPKVLRPPGALDEFAFLTACTRCGDCIPACPQDSIIKGGSNMGLGLNAPYIDPRAMPCFLCTDLPCIKACPEEAQALQWPKVTLKNGEELEGPRAVRMGTAVINENLCLTYERGPISAQACRTCVDRCPYPGVAIRVLDTEDGSIPHPEVMEEYCTGCGLCVFGCPTRVPAIIVEPRH